MDESNGTGRNLLRFIKSVRKIYENLSAYFLRATVYMDGKVILTTWPAPLRSVERETRRCTAVSRKNYGEWESRRENK